MTGFSPTRLIGGRYVVLGDLGRGDTGPVWRAADRVTGHLVAVAELHLPGRRDPDELRLIRERLLRAARAAGRLDHPSLVTAHDVVTDGDVDHIVTELVDAPTLADRVAADGPLDQREAGAMARQLAAALQAVHAAGVVHGDVSVRTILLGPDGRVWLADVGVAEAIDPLRTTRDPAFLAPELRDGGPATPESDLWALGATLHVALLGKPPAPSGDRAPVGTVGGALGDVLARLLQPAPQDRPTARQVAAAVDAPPSLAGASARRGPRWWWVAAGAVLGVLVGLAAGLALAGPRIPTLTYGPGGDVLPGPVAGACLATAPAPGAVATVMDCSGPHEAEVVATLDPYAKLDAPHPGTDVLAGFAARACTAAFEAVVEPSVRAGLELTALAPTQAAFDAGDRDVYCLVRAADGSALTGSRVAGEPR